MASTKFKPDFVTIKGTSLQGTESGPPSTVESANGKIVRSRPFYYDQAYDLEKDLNKWKMEAKGKTLEPPNHSLISFVGLSYKKRVYSKNRVMFPMKRVDWSPENPNTENRGKSGYVRISWDEAADIVADQLLKIREKYGPEAVLSESDLHGEGKHVAPSHGCPNRLLSLLGGYTIQMRNFDSWEGWTWGAKHVWGCEPVGEMMPLCNLFPDIANNSDILFFWGCDPEVTPLGINGHMASRLCYWFSEVGVKSIYVCPDLNYGAAVHADKWIPVLPNTDAALQLAIAYIWMTEGTYDKEYIATHSYGFEKFEDYVLGKEDGIPKTPKWASEKCGVPVWTIKALARDWASKKASIAHSNGGNYIRGPYATEPARLEAMLLGMRGLGKPGVHQCKMIEWSLWNNKLPLPSNGDVVPVVPTFAEMIRPMNSQKYGRFKLSDYAAKLPDVAEFFTPMPIAPQQCIPKCRIHDAILDGHIEWYGMTEFFENQAAQMVKYEYPQPGCSEVHMIWTDSPCMTTCWNDGNAYIKAVRSPKIEFMVAQHPWIENDCTLADIILPVCTHYEMDDICDDRSSGVYTSVYLEEPSCDYVGESVTDFDVVVKIAEKLDKKLNQGTTFVDAYTGKMSLEEVEKILFRASGVKEYITWEKLKEQKYVAVPCDTTMYDFEQNPPGLRRFAEDPKNHPLSTPTGLLEYSGKMLEEHFPDDPERPTVAHWIEKGETHDERISSERFKKYPLLCQSNHGRWRMHAQCDDITWTREVETMKIRAKDGYQYEPVWIHTSEAEKRGIKHGDIVKVFNERGIVLCGAYVTERITPGVAYVDHGSRMDPIDAGYIDRGGAINLITPHGNTSKNATGMVTSGFLVEVEKVTDEEYAKWQKDYPEAFARVHDEGCGVCVESWMAG